MDIKRKRRFIFYVIVLLVFVVMAWYSGYQVGYDMGRRDLFKEIRQKSHTQTTLNHQL